MQESYSGVIDLDDDDATALEVMLRYFYTGEYIEPIKDNNKLQLEVQVLTYNMADKYNVSSLGVITKEKFRSTLKSCPSAEDYLRLIPDVYTIPRPGNPLRTIVVEYARLKFRDMMQSTDLELVRTTLQDVPEFAFEVLQSFVNAPVRGRCGTCGPNQNAEVLQMRCLKCGKGGLSL